MPAQPDRIGYPVEILSGEEEAQLVFLAVLSGQGPSPGRAVVVDIGGGSTEIITGEGEGGTQVISLELGCVRLTERLIHTDPPTEAELDAVKSHVLEVFAEKLGQWNAAGLDRAIGVGGTVTAFGALDLGLVKYDPSRIENHHLTRERIDSIAKHLCTIPLAQRRDLAGVSRGRADIIPAGAIILCEFVNRFAVNGLRFHTRTSLWTRPERGPPGGRNGSQGRPGLKSRCKSKLDLTFTERVRILSGNAAVIVKGRLSSLDIPLGLRSSHRG